MPRVLVADRLHQGGLDVLKREPGFEVIHKPGLKEADLARELEGCEALLIRGATRVSSAVLEGARKLKVIGRAGVGVDHIDVHAASKRGILVMHTPTSNAVTSAEHAIALMLCLARHIHPAANSVHRGEWERSRFAGRELSGKTLGILGFGNIGRLVAERAKSFNMRVIVNDPLMAHDRAGMFGIELVSLADLWKNADIITAHTPLTPETRNLVNDTTIEKMKTGVLLINSARGGIFDEEALLRGLESGKIGALALDVFTEEPPQSAVLRQLVSHERVLATPHLGASTDEAHERSAIEVCQQVIRFFRDGIVSNGVNLPPVLPETAAKLAPYLLLARRLGWLLSQLSHPHGMTRGARPRVELECHGEAASFGPAPIINAALSGYLARFFEEGLVNEISAPILAQDRGFEIQALTSITPARTGYATLVSLRVRDEQGQIATAEATLAPDNSPRLTSLMGFELEGHLEGDVLIVESEDRPGILGALGNTFGKRGINVSRMHASTDRATKNSIAIYTIDASPPKDAIDEVIAVTGVSKVTAVSFAQV